MKIEERLHDAMHEYADTIEPEPGSWSKIAARFDDLPEPHAPRRGSFVFAGVALALVVALISVLVVRDDSGGGTRVSTGPAAGMPSRILAVKEDGHARILDSATGDQEGGIYEVPIVAEGSPIAVTPDGKDAYVVQGNGNEGCIGHSILRLPVGAGARGGDQVATGATDPTVSPDGRYLAYLHCLPGEVRAHEIVLRDLTTGEQRVTGAAVNAAFVHHLEFAADSRHVFVSTYVDKIASPRLYEIDVVAGEPVPGRDLGVVSDVQGWVAVRGMTGEYLGVKGTPPSVLAMRLPPWTARPIFTVPNTPTLVVSDRSGRHILAVVGHSLFRWSEGETEATKIADGVIGAAWIPEGSPAPPPAPTTTAMPGSLVAAVDGNRLALLAPSNGSEQTSYGSFLGISSASVTPSGKEMLFSHLGQSGACGSEPEVEVDRLNTETLAATRIVGGAVTPVVSPDGTFVAYGITCDGPALGLTDLATGQNFRTDPLGGSKRETSANLTSVEVLGWSPNSRSMLYRLFLRGETFPHYYVGTLWPAVRQSETKVVELPSGTNVSTMAFIDRDTVAVAVAKTESRTVVYEMPIGQGVKAGTGGMKWDNQTLLVTGDGMFEAPGPITSLVVDPTGRHFLALVAVAPVPPERGNPLGSSARALYRWSVGDPAPTRIAGSVTAASWAP